MSLKNEWWELSRKASRTSLSRWITQQGESRDKLLPKVGSVWCWEPLDPDAREDVVVTDVRFNGEMWMVESDNGRGRRCWNTLDRWVEAAVFLSPETRLVAEQFESRDDPELALRFLSSAEFLRALDDDFGLLPWADDLQ